jgi:Fe-S cluster biosynthesis and repair protein YggX
LSHPREEKFFIDCGIPQDVARLIDRANRHEQGLSLLGILPNQFRRILQASSANFEEPWLDISKHLFWHGYNLWTVRKKLTREFWKNIAPDDWKKHKEKDTNKINNKNLRKRKNKEIMSQCTDPFHFLKKCDNLSKEKPTICPCSEFHRPQKRSISYDIRNFVTSFPTLKCPTKIITKTQVNKSFSSKKKKFSTKEDKIRDQHDRGKKRKEQIQM